MLFRILSVVAIIALLFVVTDVSAQCAMCQGVAETSQNAGSTAASGLNKGILYILVTPYIIIMVLGYFWWKARKKPAQ